MEKLGTQPQFPLDNLRVVISDNRLNLSVGAITSPGAIFFLGYVLRNAVIPLVLLRLGLLLAFISMGKRIPSLSRIRSTSAPAWVRQW